MKRAVTQQNSGDANHGASFTPVYDSRKRKIRGLWRRGSRFYVQLRVDLGNWRAAPRRLALDARNLEEAQAELERKRTQRRDKQLPAHTLRESLKMVRKQAGLPTVGFHDLRHLFASQCVMTRLDFMAIAAWLGHSDGGILVRKVYGHLVANATDSIAKQQGRQMFHESDPWSKTSLLPPPRRRIWPRV